MMEKQLNPVIKAVQSLRKIAVDIKTTNAEIQSNDQKIRSRIEECGKLIATTNDSLVINLWIRQKSKLVENANTLLGILGRIEEKLRKKDTTDLVRIWTSHEEYKGMVLDNLIELERLGNAIFIDENLQKWEDNWKEIRSSLSEIISISDTYHLKLKMMEALKPDEIDELTMDILKHIPWNYSDNEAYQYEHEYMVAYNELKESQSRKKNLWDKILNALAGGVEETPAHRVQMRRWMDGEGDNQ
ncbi:hypothetical protein EGI16_08325 [Chryseobacterium sp. G0240]|uniref:hypothetical protein n=1 Tax=Chryseobacterium sp. G0240 TaxID=2487066 RepID=UPI000F449744|nr:hypothetical protein [Chryseobacterium sp. G0240]ROI04661.1 hypothetical protein EGI16_08325 [Chryseobacterium sp. G0240]